MQRIPKRLVAGALLTNVAAIYYTAPANTVTTIGACTLTNITGGAVTATLHLVPPGGAPGPENCILPARVIAAGEPYIVGSAIGQSLQAGGTLQGLAGAVASLALVASGYETT